MTDVPYEPDLDSETPLPEGAGTPDPAESTEPDQDRIRSYPKYVYNPISLVGLALAVAALFAILLVFAVDVTSEEPSPYIGIFGFAVLPIPLIIGLILIPVGMWIEWRKEQRADAGEYVLPTLDMNDASHRRMFLTFVTGTILLLFLTAGGSYKVYEYTESVPFCGELCHEVMYPEYVTYMNGPHARVKCVECHIGEGAEWYVRSKISGAYQFYSVLFNKYAQPIPTPIENLRPARETCEKCHWPAKFHGDQMWTVFRYLKDEENTRWVIQLVMKTGGADKTTGLIHGIHWHIAQKVEYISSDSTRTEIREVRHQLEDGSTETYKSMFNPLDEEESSNLSEEEIRVLDCMDCHNRPSHQYLSPRRAMDFGLEVNLLPRDLPYLKREGTNLLAAEYATEEEALAAIEAGLTGFYQENYPELNGSFQDDITRAIAGVQQLYSQNFFPAMKVKWSAYPTHIGHLEFSGCFRCHNGMMATDEGKVIRNDCNLCHTIIAQGPDANITDSGVDPGEFRHPEDIYEAWRDMACSECHTGGKYF